MSLTSTAPVVRRVSCATLIGATLAVLAGCSPGMHNRLEFNDVESVKITEIVLEPGDDGPGGGGNLTVTTSAIDDVKIMRVIDYAGTEPGPTYRIDGTVLRLSTSCGSRCSASYEIQAPQGVRVKGAASSGDVALTGVSTVEVRLTSGNVAVTQATGAVDVRVTSGDITLTDVAGATTVESTSGNVTGRGLGGGATVTGTSGDIELQLSRPGPIKAEVTSGNVSVRVPAGSYRVSAAASSGDSRIDIPSTPDGEHAINLSTTSGDVTVAGNPQA